MGHHVALSVVGTERMSDKGYFKAKSVQEQLIADSGIPYSIVHATQFFEFIKSIAALATDGDTVRLPPVLFQPMASEDVAKAVGRTAVGAPVNGIVEVAGPEKFRMDELVRRGAAGAQRPAPGRDATRRRCTSAPTRSTTARSSPPTARSLGEVRFRDWLERQLAAA